MPTKHTELCGNHIALGYTYDSNGRVLSYKDSDGYWWERAYDTNGRELTYKSSTGFWRKCTFDSNGRELSYKDSTGCWHERTYDTSGRELSYKDSDGFWRKCTYDSNGRELSYEDSTGLWRKCTRDTNGRELSYKTKDFDGIRIADDGEYVLHYDNTNDTFLAGCSGILTRAEAIKRWDRDDDRALLYTLAICINKT